MEPAPVEHTVGTFSPPDEVDSPLSRDAHRSQRYLPVFTLPFKGLSTRTHLGNLTNRLYRYSTYSIVNHRRFSPDTDESMRIWLTRDMLRQQEVLLLYCWILDP